MKKEMVELIVWQWYFMNCGIHISDRKARKLISEINRKTKSLGG